MQWLGDAAFSLLAEHGLDGETTRRLGINMAAVRTEIDFRRKLRAGDTVAMGAKLIAVCLDLKTRRAAPFPADISTRRAPLLVPAGDGTMPPADPKQ